MTDGRYYGRGDTTNHRLTDGEVVRLHAVRTTRQVTAEQVISNEVARDPAPVDLRKLSHLYVVAQPLASPPDLLTSLIGSPTLSNLVAAVPNQVPHAGYPSPNWQYLQTHNEPRAEGSGFCSFGLDGRQFLSQLEGAKEGGLLDVEVQDSGCVILFCGRASDVSQGNQHVVDAAIVVLTRCLITLAGQLGSTGGYAGRWLLVVGVDDLSGKFSSSDGIASLARKYSLGTSHSRQPRLLPLPAAHVSNDYRYIPCPPSSPLHPARSSRPRSRSTCCCSG